MLSNKPLVMYICGFSEKFSQRNLGECSGYIWTTNHESPKPVEGEPGRGPSKRMYSFQSKVFRCQMHSIYPLDLTVLERSHQQRALQDGGEGGAPQGGGSTHEERQQVIVTLKGDNLRRVTAIFWRREMNRDEGQVLGVEKGWLTAETWRCGRRRGEPLQVTNHYLWHQREAVRKDEWRRAGRGTSWDSEHQGRA